MIHSYPWYVGDWRSSETRIVLTLEERGLYRELLDSCYIERSLPTDERLLARIANCSDEEFKRCWPRVKPLFNESNGRLTHFKVDEVIEKLDGYHEQRKQAGRKSGERRRNARSLPVGILVDKKGNETRTIPSHPIPSQPRNTPLPPAFDCSAAFSELWEAYPAKGRVRRVVCEGFYVEEVRTPETHAAVMTAVRGKWTNSEKWRKGFVLALPDWIHNRSWDEDPAAHVPDGQALYRASDPAWTSGTPEYTARVKREREAARVAFEREAEKEKPSA